MRTLVMKEQAALALIIYWGIIFHHTLSSPIYLYIDIITNMKCYKSTLTLHILQMHLIEPQQLSFAH